MRRMNDQWDSNGFEQEIGIKNKIKRLRKDRKQLKCLAMQVRVQPILKWLLGFSLGRAFQNSQAEGIHEKLKIIGSVQQVIPWNRNTNPGFLDIMEPPSSNNLYRFFTFGRQLVFLWFSGFPREWAFFLPVGSSQVKGGSLSGTRPSRAAGLPASFSFSLPCRGGATPLRVGWLGAHKIEPRAPNC